MPLTIWVALLQRRLPGKVTGQVGSFGIATIAHPLEFAGRIMLEIRCGPKALGRPLPKDDVKRSLDGSVFVRIGDFPMWKMALLAFGLTIAAAGHASAQDQEAEGPWCSHED